MCGVRPKAIVDPESELWDVKYKNCTNIVIELVAAVRFRRYFHTLALVQQS